MSGWQSNYLQVNGARLHYTRTGGSKPPLIMAHGFSDDGPCWAQVALALESDYDIIMPDARGHGLTEVTEEFITPTHMVRDLKAIIDGLGLHKPIMLAHSMGALMTLAFAGTYPDVPKAILLEDPPAWWYKAGMPPPMPAEQLAKMRADFAGFKQVTREELIAKQHQSSPTWSDEELGPWADSKLRLSPNIIEIFASNMAASVDWPVVLHQITCPALLITADVKRGAIVSAEGTAELKKIIPHLQSVNITDAGHCIHREQMKIYMASVKAFLADVAD